MSRIFFSLAVLITLGISHTASLAQRSEICFEHYEDSCFTYIGTAKEWRAASGDCAVNGGHLVDLRNEAKSNALLGKFNETSCTVEIHSYGLDDPGVREPFASVVINGITYSAFGMGLVTLSRGISVTAFDFDRCNIVDSGHWDTFDVDGSAEQLVTFINNINPGTLILLATGDSFEARLTIEARQLLRDIGAPSDTFELRSSLSILSTKIAVGEYETHKSVYNRRHKGPSIIKYENICAPYGSALISGNKYLVPVGALSASSTLPYSGITGDNGVGNSRLDHQAVSTINAGAWSAAINDNKQWIQVDFGRQLRIRRVVTQGRNGGHQWVESFKIRYGLNSNVDGKFLDSIGSELVFTGNVDVDTKVNNEFPHSVISQYVRLMPQTWHVQVSLRWELYGCEIGIWIDGTDEGHEGVWKWQTADKVMNYTAWFIGEPEGGEENCALAKTSDGWSDEDCGLQAFYICEYPSGCPAFGNVHDCSKVCYGNCINGENCASNTGICYNGCREGYDYEASPLCNKECARHRFGASCAYVCHCKNNANCNHVTGICPDGCATDWYGVTCSERKSIIGWIVAVSLLSLIAAVAMIIAIVLAMSVKRRRHVSESPDIKATSEQIDLAELAATDNTQQYTTHPAATKDQAYETITNSPSPENSTYMAIYADK